MLNCGFPGLFAGQFIGAKFCAQVDVGLVLRGPAGIGSRLIPNASAMLGPRRFSSASLHSW